MPYKNLHVNPDDYKTFKELKHRLKIDSDVKAFKVIVRLASEKQNDLNGMNASICDGIAG